jgi:hypothetical protein
MATRTIAIDPGTKQSGVCVFTDARIIEASIYENYDLKNWLAYERNKNVDIVIEMIASYGMAVGKETFETCVWIGRFDEACGGAERLFRKEVKLHLCGTTRAKDTNIWQAIIDRYGGKESSVGNKKKPGPLYGVKSHARAALALGITWLDGVRSVGL